MPDSTLSQVIMEAYAAAPSDVVVYHTLEINHAAFTQPIYVVRDNADLEAFVNATRTAPPTAD